MKQAKYSDGLCNYRNKYNHNSNKCISHRLGGFFTNNKCNKKGNIANFCKSPTPTIINQGMSMRMGTTIVRNSRWRKEFNLGPILDDRYVHY